MGLARGTIGWTLATVAACAGVAVGQVNYRPTLSLVDWRSTASGQIVSTPAVSGGYTLFGVGSFSDVPPPPGWVDGPQLPTTSELWRLSPLGSLDRLIDRNTVVPGGAAGSFFSMVPGAGFRSAIIDPSGRVALAANVRTAAGTAYWTSITQTPDGWRETLRQNAVVAPGLNVLGITRPARWVGSELWSFSSLGPQSIPGIGEGQGDPALLSVRAGASSPTGWSRIGHTNRSGQAAATLASGTAETLPSIVRINIASGSFGVVAAPEQSVPGQSGVTYRSILPGRGPNGQLNDAGSVVFLAELSDRPTGVASLVVTNGTSARVVATEGDAVPGVAGGATLSYFRFGYAALEAGPDPLGAVAFHSQLSGVNVTSANNSALILSTPAGLQLIAREGDVVGQQRVGSTVRDVLLGSIGNVYFNQRGEALIVASTSASTAALLAYQPGTGLRLMDLAFSLPDGTTPTISDFGLGDGASTPTLSTTSGTLSSPLGDDGRFALAVRWSGGSAIVTGFIPAPGAAGVVVLAGCVVMRRRRVT